MTFTDLELAGLGALMLREDKLDYLYRDTVLTVLGKTFKVVDLVADGQQFTVVLEHNGEHFLMNGWSNDNPSSWEDYGCRGTEWDGRLVPAEKREVTTYKWVPKGEQDYAVDSWGDSWG